MLRRGARPAAWCEHDHPKEVRILGGECSVRCLGCGQAGPTRAGIVAAREALLAGPRARLGGHHSVASRWEGSQASLGQHRGRCRR